MLVGLFFGSLTNKPEKLITGFSSQLGWQSGRVGS
jgi:hypothetical protein